MESDTIRVGLLYCSAVGMGGKGMSSFQPPAKRRSGNAEIYSHANLYSLVRALLVIMTRYML
jgi:hypothetical protein